jgi:Na+(H+)/acetate symporter ActP
LWGLLFVWATQTRINTANYYLATLNMQAFFGHFGVRGSYLLWALVVGVIVYGLMLAEGFAYLLKALAYQGIFVVAVWCCSPPIISAGANGKNCKDRSIQAPLPDSVESGVGCMDYVSR